MTGCPCGTLPYGISLSTKGQSSVLFVHVVCGISFLFIDSSSHRFRFILKVDYLRQAAFFYGDFLLWNTTYNSKPRFLAGNFLLYGGGSSLPDPTWNTQYNSNSRQYPWGFSRTLCELRRRRTTVSTLFSLSNTLPPSSAFPCVLLNNATVSTSFSVRNKY